MFRRLLILLALCCSEGGAMASPGLKSVESKYEAVEAVTRLKAEIVSRGLILFASIDHAAGAAQLGLPLRPTMLLIFGNAKGGTPLMQANQEIGIDLPLKALVWQDMAGKTWISYNDPVWLAERHGLPDAPTQTAIKLLTLVESIIQAVVTKQ